MNSRLVSIRLPLTIENRPTADFCVIGDRVFVIHGDPPIGNLLIESLNPEIGNRETVA